MNLRDVLNGTQPAPTQNLINPVKVSKDGHTPGVWKSIVLDVLSVITAALFGYFYYRYLATGLSPWFVFGALLLFCTTSVMQVFLAQDVGRRFLVMIGETLAIIILFYHFDDWEILGITGVIILFLLFWGFMGSRSSEKNSIEIHFFTVSRSVIGKVTTAALLFMLLVYAPQINSGNAFVPRQSFKTFFDWASGFFNNFYPGVPFNDSFGSFTQGLAKMELQNNPTYQQSNPQSQSEEIQQASTQIANNFTNNSSTPPSSNEQTSDVMYNYIVGTLANWQSQFQNGFIIGWIIVLFIILRTVGLVFVWIAQFIAVIFYEIFLSSGFMHIEETTQTKEVIRY